MIKGICRRVWACGISFLFLQDNQNNFLMLFSVKNDRMGKEQKVLSLKTAGTETDYVYKAS